MSLFGGEFPPLRDFQVRAHEALRAGAQQGHRKQLIMAPTGAGKTILGLNVIKNALEKGKRAMFLCDRKTLIAQTSEVARAVGLGHHGIIQAQNPMFDMTRQFQIASCQTLMRRGWPGADVIIIDEAHAQYKTWVDYVNSDECTARVIGLSATPFSSGLGKTFSNLINAATMSELTDAGILVPLRVFSCRKPDMAGAETSGGEWTDRAAEERELAIIGDVVLEWGKYASTLKTIVFGATIRHCEEMARQFREAGVNCAVFCADTPDDERGRILAEFNRRDSEIRILISVEALAKGFDVKDVGCVCDCRPLRKSLSTAIQMWGRGLRSSPETGKTECILLDFSGNIIRFADDFSQIYFNGLDKLDEGEKLDKEVRKDDEDKEPKSCPKCGFSPMGKRCLQCGHEPAPKALIEHQAGEMKEVVLVNGKKLAPDEVNLWGQLATYARDHNRNGKAQGQARAWFREITGKWPPHAFTVETTPRTDPTKNTVSKIKSLQIAYIKGMAAHKGAA